MKNKNFCFFAVITIIVYLVSIYFYHGKSEQNAINQAIESANDFLRNNQAAKIFFNEDQKRKIDNFKENGSFDKNIFLPELYSCTYASTKINNYYNDIRRREQLEPIVLKFVASNPKNFLNEANQEELSTLRDFQNHKINSYHKIIENYDGAKTLYYAKPIPALQKSCLECHGNPSDAPNAIIKEYGATRGFYHQEGEIRAFVKVLMPLEKHLKIENDLFWTRTIGSFLSILSLFILVAIFMRRSQRETEKFQAVIDTLNEIVIVKTATKVVSVNKSFLSFFNVKDLKEFEKKYECLSSHFLEDDHTLNLDLTNLNDAIIEKLNQTQETEKIVKMTNHKNELRTLTVKIDKLDKYKKEYVVVLSDITQLQNRADILEKKANIDSLTQVYTRQKFEELYLLELHRSQRYINSLSILFLDIDHFKNINDIYGHDVGDSTLRDFAKVINAQIREYDVFARWGGEEFILMLPQTDINAAFKIAEKIRKSINTHKFEKLKSLTCSIGISMLQKDDDFHSLIKRADNALYKAKNTGRNKTIIDF